MTEHSVTEMVHTTTATAATATGFQSGRMTLSVGVGGGGGGGLNLIARSRLHRCTSEYSICGARSRERTHSSIFLSILTTHTPSHTAQYSGVGFLVPPCSPSWQCSEWLAGLIPMVKSQNSTNLHTHRDRTPGERAEAFWLRRHAHNHRQGITAHEQASHGRAHRWCFAGNMYSVADVRYMYASVYSYALSCDLCRSEAYGYAQPNRLTT